MDRFRIPGPVFLLYEYAIQESMTVAPARGGSHGAERVSCSSWIAKFRGGVTIQKKKTIFAFGNVRNSLIMKNLTLFTFYNI